MYNRIVKQYKKNRNRNRNSCNELPTAEDLVLRLTSGIKSIAFLGLSFHLLVYSIFKTNLYVNKINYLPIPKLDIHFHSLYT